MNIIDMNMGGRGGLGGSVSRWNFEVKVKNTTLRSVKKKLGRTGSTKKKHIHFGSD